MAASLLWGVLAACAYEPAPDLVGQWRPVDFPVSTAFPEDHRAGRVLNSENRIAFTTSGEWQSADGCNDHAGLYYLEEDGDFALHDAGAFYVGEGCRGQVPWDSVLAETATVRFTSDEAAELVSGTGELLLVIERV